jgi:heterodisulfide reductase subunit A
MMRMAGLNPYLLEMVNLREQCTRVHHQQHELANRKAQELVRVAVGRVLAARSIHKDKNLCQPAALVIGGGVSGMTAALAIADSGYDVHLVERTEMLGGNLNNLYYVAEGYDPQRLLRDLVNRVRAHRRINVHTRTEIRRHVGHVGDFRAELETRYSDGSYDHIAIEHGVTIVATGGRETREHPWLSVPRVITQRELEELIVHHPEKIAALKDVVMIQCVRPDGMPEYCSRVCCTNTMKNAIRIKLFNPACRVSVLYKNIVTYGFREEYIPRRGGAVWCVFVIPMMSRLRQVAEGDAVVRVRDLTLDRCLVPARRSPYRAA